MNKETQEEIIRMDTQIYRDSFLAISILVDLLLKENNEETGEQCPATIDSIARGIQAIADQYIL